MKVFHREFGLYLGWMIIITMLSALVVISSLYGARQLPQEGGQAGGYTLGSGDVVEIKVLDEEDLSGSFNVSSLGRISYPYLGMVDVRGMTAEDLNHFLTGRLAADYLVSPVVTVSVAEHKSKKVFIQGEVAEPGVYFLKEKSGVLNLLLEAGGTTAEASEEIVVLRPRGGSSAEEADEFERIEINLRDLLSGNMSQNVEVEKGDIIYVANASGGQFKTEGRFINIMGEVKNPGNYDFRLGLTVLNVILEAGGFTEYAAKNKVKVIKKEGDQQKVIVAKLDDLINKGRVEEDIALAPGDLVIVPQSLF